MPQLEGQPGSRGMNPPGGISTINLSNWSDPTPSRRSSSSNEDSRSFPPLSQESSGSRPSAGLSDNNNSRGIARMHQQVPGGNSMISFGGQVTAAESEALLKKRPGYDEKRREMYGSGIFNETSNGSCDEDGGFADKGPAAGENNQQQPRGRVQSDAKHKELFGSCPVDYQEPRCRPTSDAKAKELNGNNIFGYHHHPPSRGSSYHENHEDGNNRSFPPRPSRDNNNIMSPRGAGASPRSYNGEDQSDYAPLCSSSTENLNDQTGRLSFSNAKARELVGDNIFGPSPLDNSNKIAAYKREPAGKRSQMMHNNYMHDENPDLKKHEMKSVELSSSKVFHVRGNNNGGGGGLDNEPLQYQQRSVAKVREMSGSDVFSNDQPKARNTVGGIRKPPGGGAPSCSLSSS